jgi:hypothetical protein
MIDQKKHISSSETNFKKVRQTWLYLGLFFQAYLLFTLILLFQGPWPWPIPDRQQLLVYLIIAQVSILLGYAWGWLGVKKNYRYADNQSKSTNVDAGIKFLKIALLISCLLIIPTSLSRTGNIIPDIIDGLQNLGAAYNKNINRLKQENSYVLVEYTRIIVSPFLISVFPLTIVYWARMPNSLRTLAVISIIFDLFFHLATGTNKGLADFIVTAPWLVILASKSGILKVKIRMGHIFIVFSLLGLVFIKMFGETQIQREGGVGDYGVINTGQQLLYAESGSVWSGFSDSMRISYESLCRYLTSGYYALSLSMQIESPTTYGFGNSMFLTRNADMLLGTSYFETQNLPAIVQDVYGWSRLQLWHSIYPWLASDFGLYGAIIALGLFSTLLSRSWGSALITLNYKWIVVLHSMLILFYYVPANNQILQTGETCVGLIVMLFLILLESVSKRNRREAC